MVGTRKHEDKTREQTCDNTRETNAEIKHGQNTDLTNWLTHQISAVNICQIEWTIFMKFHRIIMSEWDIEAMYQI